MGEESLKHVILEAFKYASYFFEKNVKQCLTERTQVSYTTINKKTNTRTETGKRNEKI